MAYTPYATEEDFEELFPGSDTPAESDLVKASRHIDSLTYNRIVEKGFDNLTGFQQEIIKEVCCRQAAFEMENAEMLDSPLSAYSVNGVSMTFGGGMGGICEENGVVIPKSVYAMLKQTGLCCRVMR